MSAYAILNLDIHNPELMEEYKKIGPETVKKYHGKFIVRGGNLQILEGSWSPKRLVIIEFPTMEKAKEWWDSNEYQKAKTIREKASTADLLLVEGI